MEISYSGYGISVFVKDDVCPVFLHPHPRTLSIRVVMDSREKCGDSQPTGFTALKPSSTTRFWPWTAWASSEARNRAAPAMSSGGT